MKHIFAVSAILIGAFFFACDKTEKPEPADEPKGNIQISSNPAGADIYLDNIKSANVTPFTLTDLDTGLHEVRLAKSGFFDDSITVRVEDGSTAVRSIMLTPLSTPVGKIFLNSVPAGAAIFLDGNTTGKITPDTLTAVVVGDHTIKLTLSNYADSTFSVSVSENVTTSQSVTMRALPIGNVFVTSTPSGAAIFLDGVNSTKVTPDTLKNISSGDHTIKLTRTGYFDSTFTVTVPNANQTVNQSITLVALPVGNIFISSTPSGAAIFRNGVNSSKVTPDSLKNLTPGNHTVKLTLSGYFDSTFTAAVIADQTADYNITMRRIPAGNLFISSTPSSAAIFLNGSTTGKLTPDSLKNLVPGNHTIKLSLIGYVDSIFTVSVNDLQTSDYNITLRIAPKVPLVIQTIFDNHCIGCHSGTNPPQGQNLSENFAYWHIVNVASNEKPALKRILPGDPDNSYLVLKIQGTVGISGVRMPADGPPYLT
ncbi:PEGA domain-containing protein, partial [bacterium]|nr:PEGA domain-containing protein [bacterium]